jgi:DNA polymerase I-like protein with 3'-5' exonuclease and polymerase domains
MKNVLAIDTETHLFEPYKMAPPVVCLSYATSITNGVIADKELIEVWLSDHLKMAIRQKIVITAHNAAYDFSCILATFPELWNLVFRAYDEDGIACTETREKLLDIATHEFKFTITDNGRKKTGYGLDELSERRLGKKLQKVDTWRLKYKELDGVPLEEWPEDAIDYAKNDAIACLTLYENQEQRAEEISYSISTQFHDSRADFGLKLMSNWGVLTDQDYVRKRWNATVRDMTAIATDLERAGVLSLGKQICLGTTASEFSDPPDTKKSMEAIRELVKTSFPGQPPKTENGSIKTDDETIQQCNNETLNKLQEFKSLEKELSTYLKPMREPIIHSGFFGVGAASDRTSSFKPNLQNLPRKPGFRECIVPRKGWVFINCDFDSHEMRTLAQACLDIVGYSKLAEKYQQDPTFDAHQDFADKAGVSRQHAKVANFGYPGGLGPPNFVNYARFEWGIDISVQASYKLREAWEQQWPEVKEYFAHVESLVGSEDYGTQIIQKSGFRRKGVDYKQAANGYFSSLAAHGSKDAFWEIVFECYCVPDSPLYGCRPVLYIHDEVGIEAPAQYAEAAAKAMEELMVRTMAKWTPDVPASASSKIMDRWTK